MVLDALEAGAVDFIQKPTALASDRLLEMSDDLVLKVRTAAEARLRRLPQANHARDTASSIRVRAARSTSSSLGISTGGPQALDGSWSAQLPADLPVPLLVVLHMPVGYTELYARKLDELSPLHVVEASDGIEVRSGTVLIAPAGRHLTLRKSEGGTVITHLDVRPLDTPHRPSVDVLLPVSRGHLWLTSARASS